MVDYTDDWMNPWQRDNQIYEYKPPENKTVYYIEREKRQICFGYPGSITQWHYWSEYDTEEKRDEVYDDLKKRHPMWHLRKRDGNPYFEKLGIFF